MDYDKVFQEIEVFKDGHWDFVDSIREMKKLILNEVYELTQDLDPDVKDDSWIGYGSPDKKRLVLHLGYSESSVDLYATFSKIIAYASQANITYGLDFDSKGVYISRINNENTSTKICENNKNVSQWLAEQVRYYWDSPLEEYVNYEHDITRLYSLNEKIREEYCEAKDKWNESFASQLAELDETFVLHFDPYRTIIDLPCGKYINIYTGGIGSNSAHIELCPPNRKPGEKSEFYLIYFFTERSLASETEHKIPIHNRRLVDVVYEKLKEHF